MNHGRIHGANWTTGVNGTGLEFSPFDENAVYVNGRISLDISENVTIEAWVKPDNVDNHIAESEFDTAFGYHPRICYINNTIYGLVYRRGPNDNSECVLKTISINPDGSINNISLSEVVVESSCTEPKILKITNELVAISYGDKNGQCHLKTYSITGLGNITSLVDSYTAGDHCEELSFLSIQDDIYLVAYGDNQKGYLFTVNISDTGQIGPEISSFTFNQQCEDPEMLACKNSLFVLAYVGHSADYLKSFTIDEGGSIAETGFDIEYFDGSDDPSLASISEDIVAVVFEDNSKEGVLRTYNLSDAGEFTYTGYEVQFEDADCHDPYIMGLYNDVYAIAYEGPNGHRGRLAKIKIVSDGEIDSVISVSDYDTDKGFEPHMIKISDHVFIIIYRVDSPHPGGLTTFSYVADIDYPSYFAGIFKNGAYAIYANYTRFYGFINDQMVSFSGINPGWNHLAMVYDGSDIRLYVNGSEVASESYTERIHTTPYPFIIGNAFSGEIDEVAIYGSALSSELIAYHHANPGDLIRTLS